MNRGHQVWGHIGGLCTERFLREKGELGALVGMLWDLPPALRSALSVMPCTCKKTSSWRTRLLNKKKRKGRTLRERSCHRIGAGGGIPNYKSLHRLESHFFSTFTPLYRKAKRRLQLIICLSFAIQWIFTAKQTPSRRCTVSSTNQVYPPLQLLHACIRIKKRWIGKRLCPVHCSTARQFLKCNQDLSAKKIKINKNITKAKLGYIGLIVTY